MKGYNEVSKIKIISLCNAQNAVHLIYGRMGNVVKNKTISALIVVVSLLIPTPSVAIRA